MITAFSMPTYELYLFGWFPKYILIGTVEKLISSPVLFKIGIKKLYLSLILSNLI